MLSFFGKVFLLLGAAFGLGAIAGKRGRGSSAASAPSTSPETRQSALDRPRQTLAATAVKPVPASVTTADRASAPAVEPAAPVTKMAEPVTPAPLSGAEAAPKKHPAQREDPLAAKHRAAAFDRDFRTLDYRSLSKDEAAREKERRARQHSSWQAKDPASQAPSPPLQNAQFSQFGGSFVSAEIIRGRSAERVPDLMPTLPGDNAPPPAEPSVPPRRTLAGPDPRGRTPKREQRAHLPEDPLVAKHRAAPFDKDFRTLDYRKLGAAPQPLPSAAPEAAGSPGGVGAGDAAEGRAVFRIAGAAGTVPAVDTEEPAVPGDAGGQPSGAEAVLAEEVAIREPERLEAPRAGTPDDLTRIDGIGPTLERLLFENGIYHYDQIARWGAGEAHWFETRSGFPGRVARERWVEQAQALTDDRATPRAAV